MTSTFKWFGGFILILLTLTQEYVYASDKPKQVEFYIKKAEAYFLKSEFDSALVYLNIAYENSKVVDSDSLCAVIINKKATIFLKTEQLDSTFNLIKFNEKFIQNKFGNNNELYATCKDLRGDYYMNFSDVETAVIIYRQALDIRNRIYAPNNPRVAYSLSNIARYYNFKITVDSAFIFADSAYQIFLNSPENNNDLEYERILTEYAYAYKIYYRHRNKLSKVLNETRNLYFKVLVFIENKYGKNSLAAAGIYRNIGNTYTDELLGFIGPVSFRNHLYQEANRNYDKSISIISKYLQKKDAFLCTLYYVKGLLNEYAFNIDSLDKTIFFYDKSIRTLIPSYDGTTAIPLNDLKNCTSKYELMTAFYTKSFLYFKKYNYSGDSKYLKMAYKYGKELMPLWNCVIEEFESPYSNRILTIYNGKIFNMAAEFAWKLYNVTGDRVYLDDILGISEQSKGSLQQRLIPKSASKTNTKFHVAQLTVSDIQNALPNQQTLFIEFVDTTLVIGITKDHFLVKNINENINQDSLLKIYQRVLLGNNPKKYQTTAYLIYQSFFEPILSNLTNDIKYLIIANDGMISQIAVSGLVTDTTANVNDFRKLNYLVRKYAIRHVLSGSDLLKNIKNKEERPGTLVGFIPSFQANSSLPFSKSLVQSLQQKVKGDYYFDESASKENFLSHAPNYRVIQLSTHAEADLGEMMKSKLFFTDTDGDSNFIVLDSIYRMKFNTQLAILSGCETNVGRMEYGEGSLNFARAFLYAGCNSTLTTQWKVDDKSTSGILQEFYNYMIGGENLSESLRQSQLHYLKNCSSSLEANPFFWSSLVITGSDRPVYLDVKTKTSTYALIILAILLFLSGWYMYKRKREQVPNN